MNGTLAADGLGKRYRLAAGARYRTLREALAGTWRRRDPQPELWALRNVSFRIEPGETVGIIGRNGAGKSTLLKLLSRVTRPTAGRAEVHGRIGSLLEVGTGFHPELTGRENILLNGAIIGMSRREIRERMDAIVAFSGVERFLDQPVKRYSSGMQMRLAFAVAAHLPADVLLLDEVLAVGDAEFQAKSLQAMDGAARSGRTVLLVSHNLDAVLGLCHRAIWLDGGRIRQDGPAREVVSAYLAAAAQARQEVAALLAAQPEDPDFRMLDVRMVQDEAPTGEDVRSGTPLCIEIDYRVLTRTTGLRIFIDLLDRHEALLVQSFHDGDADSVPIVEPGTYRSTVVIPADFLGPEHYTVVVRAGIYDQRPCEPIAGVHIPLRVLNTGALNRAYPEDTFRARLAPRFGWTTCSLG